MRDPIPDRLREAGIEGRPGKRGDGKSVLAVRSAKSGSIAGKKNRARNEPQAIPNHGLAGKAQELRQDIMTIDEPG